MPIQKVYKQGRNDTKVKVKIQSSIPASFSCYTHNCNIKNMGIFLFLYFLMLNKPFYLWPGYVAFVYCVSAPFSIGVH